MYKCCQSTWYDADEEVASENERYYEVANIRTKLINAMHKIQTFCFGELVLLKAHNV